eukprot:gb/GFBE01044814.1/.p1 GENE.gb/GFBE01044814.1/~~gb/GFBE01044814.1/.p1  ORF type:complete len:648 (+),score=127.74 gb/GFBE01044814.1/:1-1944(+)
MLSATMPCIDGAEAAPSKCQFVYWEAECGQTVCGDTLAIVGSTSIFGNWNPCGAQALSTTADMFPRWRGSTVLKDDDLQELSWKFIIVHKDGSVTWEEGNNRMMNISGGSAGLVGHLIKARFGFVNEPVVPMRVHSEVRESGFADVVPMISQTHAPTSSEVSTNAEDARDDSLCDDASPVADNEGFWMYSGACRIGKISGACEDAYFVSEAGLVVADGVGSMVQFARFGIDAAAYAAQLVELAGGALGESQPSCMQAATTAAQAAVCRADLQATKYGASTILAVSFCGGQGVTQPCLGAANLGDSGFMVLRQSGQSSDTMEVIARSPEQQHRFNTPYQLTHLPPALKKRVQSKVKFDSAADCDIHEVELKAGDLLLAYSDGFSDNLHQSKMLELVIQAVDEDNEELPDPEALAHRLASAAQAQSLDPEAEVPFALTAREAGEPHHGGKEDDITVIAAWIMPPRFHVQPRILTQEGAASITDEKLQRSDTLPTFDGLLDAESTEEDASEEDGAAGAEEKEEDEEEQAGEKILAGAPAESTEEDASEEDGAVGAEDQEDEEDEEDEEEQAGEKNLAGAPESAEVSEDTTGDDTPTSNSPDSPAGEIERLKSDTFDVISCRISDIASESPRSGMSFSSDGASDDGDSSRQ